LSIQTSSIRKTDIYLLGRHSNDSKLKNCYKWYCKILSDVIKEAKKYHNNKLRFKIENEHYMDYYKIENWEKC
jgi:hypothetical protein